VWAVFMAGAAIAAAQGSPAPGANQAFLYEMDEDAVLLNSAGQVLVPDPSGKSPTGLVDATNGAVGIPAVRHATSQLQGVAALGQPSRRSAKGSAKGDVLTHRGERGEKVSRTDPSARRTQAYYLLDDGSLQRVRPDERAVGWPTVRFEITF